MSASLLLAMVALGLASGVHCVGMCGGFVAAFSSPRVIRIVPEKNTRRILLFNAGRITTYAALGAASGFLGGELAFALGAQTAVYAAANVMLIGVGLYLAGMTGFLAPLEKLAGPLWRAAQPLLKSGNAYVPGLAWGFIPCGLVYGALAAASLAGSATGGAARSALGGAAAMAAYGLGTLPWLLSAGFLASFASRPILRRAMGAGVLAFGVYGLAHAGGVAGGLRGLICP
jgi:sulfite exporter TauE/SafE